jgi:hypothetical protein
MFTIVFVKQGFDERRRSFDQGRYILPDRNSQAASPLNSV